MLLIAKMKGEIKDGRGPCKCPAHPHCGVRTTGLNFTRHLYRCAVEIKLKVWSTNDDRAETQPEGRDPVQDDRYFNTPIPCEYLPTLGQAVVLI